MNFKFKISKRAITIGYMFILYALLLISSLGKDEKT